LSKNAGSGSVLNQSRSTTLQKSFEFLRTIAGYRYLFCHHFTQIENGFKCYKYNRQYYLGLNVNDLPGKSFPCSKSLNLVMRSSDLDSASIVDHLQLDPKCTQNKSGLCCSHDSALCSIAHIGEYLREFEAEFENI
jgi:hypothetical protein